MPSLGEPPEVPCASCGRRVTGLPWGERCSQCLLQRKRRASRLSGRVALAATIVAALYVWLRVPADPTARYYGLLAIVVTYILVRRIAARIALEAMK
ncbi:MAG: hypothetical protein H0T90_08725 [Gemmatimonadales bacterium]|nr:hypothetical protein [Gemmatimonadales bacterium]